MDWDLVFILISVAVSAIVVLAAWRRRFEPLLAVAAVLAFKVALLPLADIAA